MCQDVPLVACALVDSQGIDLWKKNIDSKNYKALKYNMLSQKYYFKTLKRFDI